MLFVGLTAFLPAPVAAQDLTVSAAISLKESLTQIADAFEAANPGVTVSLNLGASGDLQRQIEAGAPVDVFISAASAQMDALESRGGVDPRTRRDVACNSLVVVAPVDASSGPGSLADLEKTEHIALGNPKTVPAGQYAKQALESAGLWTRLQPRLVFAENVRQALDYVARGEAEAGFVYATDAGVIPDQVRVAFEVDPAAYEPIRYPAAVVAGTRQRELARRFVEFLSGAEATAALEQRGFSLPPCKAARGR
ncbi:MAG TPA: molybdate ABC transporter substrate-binding protein [Gemmatimonadota bacterium]